MSRLLKYVQKTIPVIIGRNPTPTTTTTTTRRPPLRSSSTIPPPVIPPPPPPSSSSSSSSSSTIPPVLPASSSSSSSSTIPSVIRPPSPSPSTIPALSYLRASSSYVPPPLVPHLRVRPPSSYFTPASSSIVTPPLLSSSSSSLIRNIYPNTRFIHEQVVIPEDGGFLSAYFPQLVFGSLSRAQSKVIQFLMSGAWDMGFFVGGPSLAQINLFFQTLNAVCEAYEALQPYGLAFAERIRDGCLRMFKKKKNNNNNNNETQQPQQQQQPITVPCFQLLSEPNRIKFACLLFGVTEKDHIGFQIYDNKSLVINAVVANVNDLDPLTAILDLPPGDFSNVQTSTKFSKKNGVFLIDIQGFQITTSSSS